MTWLNKYLKKLQFLIMQTFLRVSAQINISSGNKIVVYVYLLKSYAKFILKKKRINETINFNRKLLRSTVIVQNILVERIKLKIAGRIKLDTIIDV